MFIIHSDIIVILYQYSSSTNLHIQKELQQALFTRPLPFYIHEHTASFMSGFGVRLFCFVQAKLYVVMVVCNFFVVFVFVDVLVMLAV